MTQETLILCTDHSSAESTCEYTCMCPWGAVHTQALVALREVAVLSPAFPHGLSGAQPCAESQGRDRSTGSPVARDKRAGSPRKEGRVGGPQVAP